MIPSNSIGVLIVLLIAVFFWLTEKIHPAVTGLLIIVLLSLFGGVDFSLAISGFADNSVWLLIGVFILSAAMDEIGLDKRIAYSFIAFGRDSAKKIIYMAYAATVLFVFLLPAAVGRTAILVPIWAGIVKTAGLEKSNFSKVMTLSTTYVTHCISTSLITGALATVYTSSLLEKSLDFSFTYMGWIMLMAPPAIISSFLALWIVMKMFPIENVSLLSGREMVEAELSKMGKINNKEIKLIALYCLMFLLLFTNHITSMPLGLSVLIVSILVFMPGISLIKWNDAAKKVDWGAIMIFGGSLGLAAALKETGTIDWLSGLAFGITDVLPIQLIAVAIYLICLVIRLGFGSVIGFVTAMLPLAIATGLANDINPVWLTMVSLLGSQLCFFLPSQSPANLPAYSTGFFKTNEMVKTGAAISLMYIVISTISAYLYWPLVGLAP